MPAFENDTIKQLIDAFLIIIPAAASLRVLLCAMAGMHDEEKKPELKRRGLNAMKYAVLAEIVTGLIALVYQYYGGN